MSTRRAALILAGAPCLLILPTPTFSLVARKVFCAPEDSLFEEEQCCCVRSIANVVFPAITGLGKFLRYTLFLILPLSSPCHSSSYRCHCYCRRRPHSAVSHSLSLRRAVLSPTLTIATAAVAAPAAPTRSFSKKRITRRLPTSVRG